MTNYQNEQSVHLHPQVNQDTGNKKTNMRILGSLIYQILF